MCSDGSCCVYRVFPQFRRQMSFSASLSRTADHFPLPHGWKHTENNQGGQRSPGLWIPHRPCCYPSRSSCLAPWGPSFPWVGPRNFPPSSLKLHFKNQVVLERKELSLQKIYDLLLYVNLGENLLSKRVRHLDLSLSSVTCQLGRWWLINLSGLQFPLLWREDDDMVSIGLLWCLDRITYVKYEPSALPRMSAHSTALSPSPQYKAEVSAQAHHQFLNLHFVLFIIDLISRAHNV